MRRLSGTLLCIAWVISAPFGSGQTQRLRIPAQNGVATVREYIAALKSIDPVYLSNWAKFHNGWGGGFPPEDNCSHRNAQFLIWHHAYLVLTEELFARALHKAEFAMPFWSPVQGETVPDVFSCQSDECKVLFAPDRFRPSNTSFAGAYSKWRELSNCASASFFCPFDCNGNAIDPLGGKSIEDGNATQGGSIELMVHDPVHDAGCVSAVGLPPCSPIGKSYSAALDPIFQPFHAGIDAAFVALLTKPNIHCEVCAEKFIPKQKQKTQRWSEVSFLLPEPRCLSVSGTTISINENFEYETGERCGSLDKKPGNIPVRKFLLKDILTDARFWQIGYPGAQADEVIGVGAQCPLVGELANCPNVSFGTVSCAQAERVQSLRLSRRFLWIEGDQFRGDRSKLSESFFRVQIAIHDPAAREGNAYSVVLKSGPHTVQMGAVQKTPWEISLHGKHEHAPGRPTQFELLPDQAGQKRIAALLATGKRISAEVSSTNRRRGKHGSPSVILDILPRTPSQ